MSTTKIDVTGRSREELLIIAERACACLVGIANCADSEEANEGATDDEFGLWATEVALMERDDIIGRARRTLESIASEFPRAA